MMTHLHKLEKNLSALRAARRNRNQMRAQGALGFFFFLVAFFLAFAASCILMGYPNTIVATLVVGGILTYLALHTNALDSFLASGNARLEKSASADGVALKIEHVLLQNATSSVSAWLRMSFSAPSMFDVLKKSGLMKLEIHSAQSQRCLAGMYAGETPVCASYVLADRTVVYTDSNQKTQTRKELVFQGLVVLMDFPTPSNGWVKLSSDNLEAFNWMADGWRRKNETDYIRLDHPEFEKHFHVNASSQQEGYAILTPQLMQALVDFTRLKSRPAVIMMIKENTLMLVVPMKKSPFHMTDNESIWQKDLNQFLETVELVDGLAESLRPFRRSVVNG